MSNKTELSGHCLCGVNSFTITGTTMRFLHCHCSRCRRISGTGHASNLIMKDAEVHWNAAAETRGHYAVPDAERFASHFCRECGSPLPRENPAINMVVVPAGSLNGEPPLAPEARIFQASAVSWSCNDELPKFDNYPK